MHDPSFRCDWCERRIPAADEEELKSAGWCVVNTCEESFDFCCPECLGKWAYSDDRMFPVSVTWEDGCET